METHGFTAMRPVKPAAASRRRGPPSIFPSDISPSAPPVYFRCEGVVAGSRQRRGSPKAAARRRIKELKNRRPKKHKDEIIGNLECPFFSFELFFFISSPWTISRGQQTRSTHHRAGGDPLDNKTLHGQVDDQDRHDRDCHARHEKRILRDVLALENHEASLQRHQVL